MNSFHRRLNAESGPKTSLVFGISLRISTVGGQYGLRVLLQYVVVLL